MARKRVLICGYYGNYNLGDEAMLTGMLRLLRQEHDQWRVTVFSKDTQDTKIRHSVEAIPYQSGEFKAQYNLTLLQNQYFILGGGDLLRDSVNNSKAERWLRPLQQAIRLRRRTLVLGISVGEIWRKETQKIIPQVLDQVNLLAVRDADSKTQLEKLGVRKNIHVMSDLALHGLPELSPQSTTHLANQPIQIGIAVRPLVKSGYSTDVNAYFKFQQEIAAIADFLAEQYGATIHFFPFQALKTGYHPTDDDRISILNILRYSRCSNQFVVHHYFESLQNLIQLISQLDLTIGMRLHSLILSAGLGVPVIAVEYASKVRGFMQEIGQGEYSIPIECFNREQLLPIIRDILNDPLMARKHVAAGIKNYRQGRSGIQQVLAQTLA
ncbi:polysaccharide pyruvyl transferase family protein [Gloeocapsopsis dulcis]|uniref:Polysaccharide pyruvyl transferase domain-containing protein n=1 Tax=Gloeocapsopsis dulcis AAB1 = 1H9 TaxID=1433147 RepID=A0A6N8FV17_9CHRO|nr:polysaccharide pyruvyl transferase family protein [Gloeocapsopsis dulcis]MUL35997.1 hypothetical protein [Gloeocapsopsis dulcis AAB1 = 1H9]WNN88250.1 polysaccharide pyruvyl transferase family protein [Gloeocapsopsis dulcis]